VSALCAIRGKILYPVRVGSWLKIDWEASPTPPEFSPSLPRGSSFSWRVFPAFGLKHAHAVMRIAEFFNFY
jgi:hypothetical protein